MYIISIIKNDGDINFLCSFNPDKKYYIEYIKGKQFAKKYKTKKDAKTEQKAINAYHKKYNIKRYTTQIEKIA